MASFSTATRQGSVIVLSCPSVLDCIVLLSIPEVVHWHAARQCVQSCSSSHGIDVYHPFPVYKTVFVLFACATRSVIGLVREREPYVIDISHRSTVLCMSNCVRTLSFVSALHVLDCINAT